MTPQTGRTLNYFHLTTLMSLDTLNNGDSGLEARTKINAAIAAVNDSGGCDVQDFSSDATWTKPVNAKMCRVILIGQGGNGGAGGVGGPGAGGGPGGVTVVDLSAQSLGETESIVIDGNSIQFAVFFATHGGNGGSEISNSGTGGGPGSVVRFSHPPFAVDQFYGGNVDMSVSEIAFVSPTGGGAGGFTNGIGFAGGEMSPLPSMAYTAGGAAGVYGNGAADGTPGGPGNTWDIFGTGGGGGGGGQVDEGDPENPVYTNGGAGGAGANFGGGGGGGGASAGSASSGGTGGLPLCRVITWL